MVGGKDYGRGFLNSQDFHGGTQEMVPWNDSFLLFPWSEGPGSFSKNFFQTGECRKYLVFMRKTEHLIQKSVQKAAQSVTGVLKGRRVE